MSISALLYVTALTHDQFYKACTDFNVISKTSPYEVTSLGSNVIELTKCSCQVLTFD